MQLQRKTVAFNCVANAGWMVMLLLAVVGFASGFASLLAHADGGVVQFEKSAGPFVVTVFTTPSPLRAGRVDISLMIQSRENEQPVLDCQAFIQLRKEGAVSIRCEATHEAAQNKLLYAAPIKISEPGLWELEVTIKHDGNSTAVGGEITVASPAPVMLAYWRSLLLPPLIISLFGLNQWLKRRGAERGRG